MLRRLLGDEIERELRPVLAAIAFGFGGVFAFVAFFAIWAVDELGAERGTIGLAFTGAAVAGIAGAVAGGRLSDRIGRKPVIVAAAAAQTAAAAFLLLPPSLPLAFGVLATLSFLQPLRGSVQRALVADLVARERLESGFGALRIAINTGASCGPLAGAALVAVGWTALHAGIVVLFGLSLFASLRLPSLPPVAAATGTSFFRMLRHPGLALVLLAGIPAWITYQAFETVLPVELAASGAVSPALWGLLFALNPVLTVLLQLRIARWGSGLRPDAKLCFALALMGLPFLALTSTAAVPVLLAIVLCVTLGEMLWAPTSETLVVRAAPDDSRGAALGAFTATSWLGTALGPALAFQVAAVGGPAAMWISIASVALLAAGLYALACSESGVTVSVSTSGR